MASIASILASPPPLTEQAVELDRVWSLFLWIAVAVGILVLALIVWVVLRYRRSTGDGLPAQRHEHIPLEVFYTAVPLLVVAGLFAVTIGSLDSVEDDDADPDLVVEVIGYQWQWQFDYPASGARSEAIDGGNPELVLPASSTVRFEMTSIDVVHSFWIPSFRFKRDVFPGETTTFQVDVGSTTGSYVDAGVCAEFCGLDHHRMTFDVLVVSQAEFDTWAAEHQIADQTEGSS